MYPTTIAEACDVICKYKRPENSTRLNCNRIDVSFYQQWAGNQTCPPVTATADVHNRDVMWHTCDSLDCYYGKFPLTDIRRTGTHPLQLGYSFAHTTPVHKYLINNIWILLDPFFNVIYVMNLYLLSDTKNCNPYMAIRVFRNSGNLYHKQSVTVNLLT